MEKGKIQVKVSWNGIEIENVRERNENLCGKGKTIMNYLHTRKIYKCQPLINIIKTSISDQLVNSIRKQYIPFESKKIESAKI